MGNKPSHCIARRSGRRCGHSAATQTGVSYTSEAQFEAAAASLPVGSWVMYGLESTTNSPLAEKQDPKTYLSQFSRTAHDHGLHSIIVPGIDLVNVSGSNVHANPGEPGWQAYLRTGIPGACDNADVFLCESQSLQAQLATFNSLLSQAKAQVPDAVMWGGLTTDRSSDTAQNYAAAYAGGLGLAAGRARCQRPERALVRPDGHLAAVLPEYDPASLTAALRRAVGSAPAG